MCIHVQSHPLLHKYCVCVYRGMHVDQVGLSTLISVWAAQLHWTLVALSSQATAWQVVATLA